MKNRKITGVLAVTLLWIAGFAGSSLRADDDATGAAKKATIAIQSPMQIPGTVLKPGHYVFKLSSAQSGWNIVQIYDESETTLITTVLACPNPKLSANGQTVLTYGAGGSASIAVLEAVVLPGEEAPEQFAYPKRAADRIGVANHVRIPTTGTNDSYPSSLPDAATSWSAPVNDAPVSATDTDANSGQTMIVENATVPATDPSRLPQTASSLPLIGLVGLLSLAGIVALRKFGAAKS